jgi:DNA polymerase-4
MNYRWMYIDFNSYFASVEQELDAALRNKPIAVIPVGSDATCAIAASYEAKAFGIKTGTPIWEAKKMCPNLICVLAKHEAYVEFHEKILKEIDRHVPIAKVCSIDEVACQLMENESANAAELAKKIKKGLRENVGECIRCSIGFAPNRYLAKVATDMQKPDGLVLISLEDLPQKLYSLTLRDLPGIGAKLEKRLKRQGILDLKMLCSLDLGQMRKAWGSIEGERMWHHLKGIDLPERAGERKSLGHSHVMAPELRSPEKMRDVGRRLTAKAASRLRRMGLVASKMSLSIALEDGRFFELHAVCHRANDTLRFLALFQKMWEEGICHRAQARMKKIAILFSELEELNSGQGEFFKDPLREKGEKISSALDLINQKYGKDSLSFGVLPQHEFFSGTKIAFTRIPEKEEFLE